MALSGRQFGQMTAGFLGTLVVMTLLFVWLTAPPAPRTETPIPLDLDPPVLPRSPDAGGDAQRAGARPGIEAVGKGEGATFRQLDPATGLVRTRLRAETFDPVGEARYEVTGLKVTLFLRSDEREPTQEFAPTDRLVTLTAPRAELVGQAIENPDSGTLEGGVEVRVFAPGVSSDDLDSAQAPVPEATLRTPLLRFDNEQGEFAAPRELELLAAPFGFELLGSDLTVRLADFAGSDNVRPSLIRLASTQQLLVWPDRLARDDDDDDQATQQQPASGEAERSTDPGDAAVEASDVYTLRIVGDVRISHTAGRIAANTISAAARFVGAELAPGAIAPLSFDFENDEPAPPTASDPSPPPPSTSTLSDDQATEPIEVVWSGPLEVRRLEDTSTSRLPEGEDAYVELGGLVDGDVRLTSARDGATVIARDITYYATTAELQARADKPEGLEFTLPDRARLRTQHVIADLAQPGRVAATAITPGVGTTINADPPATAHWNREATLDLLVDDGGLRADQATLTGEALLTTADEADRLAADVITASFRNSAEGRLPLERLQARTLVRASLAEGSTLAADALDVEFTDKLDPTVEPQVRTLAATGAVILEAQVDDGVERLEATDVRAEFVMGDNGGLIIDEAVARGDARWTRPDATTLTADEIRASQTRRRYAAIGTPARAATTRNTETLAFASEQLLWDDEARTLTAFGGGEATFDTPPGSSTTPLDTGRLTWRGPLTYDEAARSIEASEDVLFNASEQFAGGAWRVISASATRMVVELTEAVGSTAPEPKTLQLFGGDTEADAFAEIEERRYAISADADEQLLSLVAARGDAITADLIANTAAIPSAGRLVVDRRESERPSPSTSRETALSEQGSAVFLWEGRLDLDLARGVATMRNQVRVTHQPLDDTTVTTLLCERLTATFATPESGGDDPARPLSGVRTIQAQQGVYMRREGLELLCDTLTYRALTQSIVAAANPGNRLTVVDPTRGGEFTARSIEFDLVTGSWRTIEAVGGGGAGGETPDGPRDNRPRRPGR